MSDDPFEQMLSNVIKTLSKNGFPDQRVALPLERMYEAAHAKGLNFNKVLAALDERGVSHEKTDDRIIFCPKAEFGEMMAQAQRIFAGMSEEQRRELLKQAKELGFTP